MQTTLNDRIKKNEKSKIFKRLIIAAIAIVTGIAILYFAFDVTNVFTLFQKPVQIKTIEDISKGKHGIIAAGTPIETTGYYAYDEDSKTHKQTTTGYYEMITLEDGKFLISLVSIAQHNTLFSVEEFADLDTDLNGYIRTFDSFDKTIIDEIITDYNNYIDEYELEMEHFTRDDFADFVFDFKGYKQEGLLVVFFVFVAVSLFFILFTIFPIITMNSPKIHKIYRKAGKLGNSEQIIEQIDRETASAFYNENGLIITKTYFVALTGYTAEVLRTDSFRWAYKYVYKYNGVETIIAIMAYMSDGSIKRINLGKHTTVDEGLEVFRKSFPTIMSGYDKQLLKLFKKDRNAFNNTWASHCNQVASHENTQV